MQQAQIKSYILLLKEDNDFNKIHQSIGHTLYNTINLRNPTPNDKIQIAFEASWGICHEEGDSTQEHIHPFINFSGAFYFDVPTETRMWFEDFQQDVKLENNMLILFPSLCKHRVHKHIGKQPRISMAFNINCIPLDQHSFILLILQYICIMPLVNFRPAPGINKEVTDYTGQGMWTDGDMVRFFQGSALRS